ncbi:recombinase family protein [Reinekea blandensis]|nr:recombinase family protein [Reinekea blandensis]
MVQFVIYKRVSTKKQGDSGLGLEAQERDIQLYLDNYAGDHEVIDTFVDVLSGKDGVRRPAFLEAVELAKKTKATLLVAKLDRISRDVETIAGVIKRIDVKVAVMPHADKFQLHIYAALAEQEREFISIRTKQALAEVKAKGVKLGGLRDKTAKRNVARKEQAKTDAESLRGLLEPMVKQGLSLRAIAAALNDSGQRTSRGSTYQPTTVQRALKRLELSL